MSGSFNKANDTVSQSTEFRLPRRLEARSVGRWSALSRCIDNPDRSSEQRFTASLLRGIVSYTKMPRHPAISREILNAAMEGLERQKTRIEEQIIHVRALLGIRKGGRPPKNAAAQEAPNPPRKRRKMSAAARKRIGDATP